jgi:hypothetical protein
LGSRCHSSGKLRTIGTITASRPPGRRTRAISESACAGSGISWGTAGDARRSYLPRFQMNWRARGW